MQRRNIFVFYGDFYNKSLTRTEKQDMIIMVQMTIKEVRQIA